MELEQFCEALAFGNRPSVSSPFDASVISSMSNEIVPSKKRSREYRDCGLDGPAAGGPQVSTLGFRAEFENLRTHLREHDGFPFESFTRGKIHDWESYKDFVFAEAGRRLEWTKWKAKEIGTGKLLDRIVHAVEIDEGKKRRNNLLQWKQYGIHKVLFEARDDDRRGQVERLLFDFYTDEREAAEVFDPLVELLGGTYPLIAYLFFIKDSSRFLPIAPKKFDRVFERLGADLKTSHRCGWDNYSTYLAVIREIRELLEIEGMEGVRLLDAHSFCWLIASLDEPNRVHPNVAFTEESVAFSREPEFSSHRGIDWEAHHRARAALGRLGEEISLKAERERLCQDGRPDLAERAHLVSDDHSKGYDLHSFETDGSDRLIEVKTVGDEGSALRFFTSRCQLELAHSGANHFYYIVEGARSKRPRIRALRADAIPTEAMVPVVYEVRVEVDSPNR